MNEIHAIQHFDGEIWKTIYMSTYPQDVSDTYMDICDLTRATLRAVRFTVDSYDFIATQARDFAVLALRKGQTNSLTA